MTEISMTEKEAKGYKKAFDYCLKWGTDHQAEIGVAEMALGAGIISWGLQNGFIEIGKDVVGSKLAEIGGTVGAGLGAAGAPVIATTILKSVFIGGITGIQGVTMAPAIPAILLVGGGAMVLGAFGYTAGDIVEGFIDSDLSEHLNDASIVAVGLALLIDGSRRVVKDERVLEVASDLKEDVIRLTNASTGIVVKSWEELQTIINEIGSSPEAGVMTGGATVAGAAIGGTLAAGTVTVLGSHGLGAVALSLGLVSAPVWPIIAGGIAGLAVGFSTWRAFKYVKSQKG